MGVGAIGAVSGAVYNPYVYNTNTVSSASLNKVNAIPDDVLRGGVDYKGLTTEAVTENVNPLRPGETKNFADVLLSQFAASAMRRDDLLSTNV